MNKLKKKKNEENTVPLEGTQNKKTCNSIARKCFLQIPQGERNKGKNMEKRIRDKEE